MRASRNSNSWLRPLLLIAVAAGTARALSPLEQDRILFEGPARLVDGRTVLEVQLPAGQKVNGCYLNVDGLACFSVTVNGTPVRDVVAEDCSRSRFGAVELGAAPSLFRTGANRIELESDEPDHDYWLRLWVSDMAWYIGSCHGHSTYSDGAYTVHEILDIVNGLGGSFYALTDHSTLAQCSDTGFHPVGNLQPLRGTEWTTDSGHSCVLGLQGNEPIAEGSVADLIDDATYRGGMMQINHPTDLTMEWLRRPVLDPGVDAIEIFNGPTWFPSKGKRGKDSDADAVAWWHELLVEGKTIAGVGNSDYHGTIPSEAPLTACSRVFAPSNDLDSILKYWKLGQVMVCDNEDDSRLYLYADTNNNGVWDLVMGQHARIPSGSRTIRFRLEVEDADWTDVVYVYDKSGEVYSHTLWTGGDYDYEWSRTYTSSDVDFMRVELCAELGADYEYCTNPVYINHPDYELGPLTLRASAELPDSAWVGSETLLQFRVANQAGVSPYRAGLVVACDTARFDITEWQTSGNGVGQVLHRFADGYEIIEWRSGHPWSYRLSAGSDFQYWLKVRPKQVGNLPVLTRGWADDRIFTIARDPMAGTPGPEELDWHSYGLRVFELTGAAENPAGMLVTRLNPVRPMLVRGVLPVEFVLGGQDWAYRLELLNVAGRVERSLNLSGLQSGAHTFRFGVDGLGAGVRFVRLLTSGGAIVQRFALLD